MKRLMATSLLFLYLTSFTEFSEILRLPILLEHYREHQSKVEDLSFMEFLTMHYETDVAHDETDNSLPFKGHDHSCCSATVILPIQKLALNEVTPNSAQAYSSYYLQHKPALRIAEIFQPPKI
jgi:hypothetical protein